MNIRLVKSGEKILGLEKEYFGSFYFMLFPETEWRIGLIVRNIGEQLTYISL